MEFIKDIPIYCTVFLGIVLYFVILAVLCLKINTLLFCHVCDIFLFIAVFPWFIGGIPISFWGLCGVAAEIAIVVGCLKQYTTVWNALMEEQEYEHGVRTFLLFFLLPAILTYLYFAALFCLIIHL